jgi:hypothetical protein
MFSWSDGEKKNIRTFFIPSMAGVFKPLIRHPCAYCTLNKVPQKDTSRQQCGGCKAVFYCNSACQQAHWSNGHRMECREMRPYAEFVACARTICQVLYVDTTNVFPYPFGLTDKGMEQQRSEQLDAQRKAGGSLMIEDHLFLFEPYQPDQLVTLSWDIFQIRVANALFSISTAEQIVVWANLHLIKRVRDHAAGFGLVVGLLSAASNKLLAKSEKGCMHRIHAAFTCDFHDREANSYARLERGTTGEWTLNGKVLQDESLLRPGEPMKFFASDITVPESCVGDIVQADILSPATLRNIGPWDLIVVAFTDVPLCEPIGLHLAMEAARTGAPVLCIDTDLPGMALSHETQAYLAAHFQDAGLVFPAMQFTISGKLARIDSLEDGFGYNLVCKILLPKKTE